jgi:type II secretory pathway pseudopilin PulG
MNRSMKHFGCWNTAMARRKKRTKEELRAEVMRLAQSGYQLTTKQAALYVGLTERTLETYRNTGKLPRYVKINHHIRYPAQFLDEFLRASTTERAQSGHSKLNGNQHIGVSLSHA